jgi:prepilin-type N-terminal cleavage/methylation domain-containing protein
MGQRQHAFTLIELLIVVAIIAILAAIAVPNFLEAQVRSKVSRVKADQRTMATAMEAYYVDNNMYPPEHKPGTLPEMQRVAMSLAHLTSPVAYLTSIPPDPFKPSNRWEPPMYWYYNWLERYDTLINVNKFQSGNAPWYNEEAGWILTSLGPDRDPNFPMIYDATNGTVSTGDISRLGPGGGGSGK